jgi:hypothetical protein
MHFEYVLLCTLSKKDENGVIKGGQLKGSPKMRKMPKSAEKISRNA